MTGGVDGIVRLFGRLLVWMVQHAQKGSGRAGEEGGVLTPSLIIWSGRAGEEGEEDI